MLRLNEIEALEELASFQSDLIQVQDIAHIDTNGTNLPIKSFIIGSKDPTTPSFGLFGGVHGLERIGSQVAIAFLRSLFEQLKWDRELVENFSQYRLISIPVINPGGIALRMRSNPNHVDLMRNSPVEASKGTIPFLSGHRFSKALPWHRGTKGVLEPENEAVINFVKKQMFPSKRCVSLDLHSGFGMKDRLWWPYAKSHEPFPFLSQTLKLKELLDTSYPHHIYKMEPQAESYLTHGDLWDHLLDIHEETTQNSVYIPLTLEMGSWNWVRKNPMQFFSKEGLFSPVKSHRQARVMRRHLLLLDFLFRAVRNHHSWS